MTAYQKQSETSRAAAEELSTAENMRSEILAEIKHQASTGRTGDELSEWFDIVPGTISARLIELERSGHVFRVSRTRTTQSNRQAYVYVAKEFVQADDEVLRPADEEKSRNREIVSMAADFIAGMIKAKQLPSAAYEKRAGEIAGELRSLLKGAK